MKRIVATMFALAIFSGVMPGWQSAPQTASTPTHVTARKRAKAARKKAQLETKAALAIPAQENPPVPATLMNRPPVPPVVTMNEGLLTIDAPNCTLIDVLNGVHRITGATIEGATPTERIAVKLGPGVPELVLASLLRGTPYDYVILGTPGKPDALARIMLTLQNQQGPGGPREAAENAGGQPGGGMGRPHGMMLSPRQPQGDIEANPEDNGAPEAEEEQPQPGQQQPPTAQPEQQQPPQDSSQQQNQSDSNQPKTPEQLFKELQQLNQQKQTQQQQQQPQ
jgi:hypothetical protein